jgi:hypothetical protein
MDAAVFCEKSLSLAGFFNFSAHQVGSIQHAFVASRMKKYYDG